MKLISFYIMLILTMLIVSCDDAGVYSNRDIIFPEKEVSYLYHVEPFLKITCTYAGCHGFTNAGNMRFDTYFELMKIPGFVVPGQPNSSQIIQLLENETLHITYYYRGNLKENHKIGMRKWISEGAKLN